MFHVPKFNVIHVKLKSLLNPDPLNKPFKQTGCQQFELGPINNEFSTQFITYRRSKVLCAAMLNAFTKNNS